MTAATASRPAARARLRGFPIARVTLLEAVSRRLILWGLVLSALFVALFSVGFVLLMRRSAEFAGEAESQAVLTVLGLYVVSFLASFMALLLSVASVASEAEAGTLQAVLARPLRRRSWLLQRWSALAGLVGAYAIGMGAALLLVARIVAGYSPVGPGRTLLLLAGQSVAVLTLGMLASTRLATLAAGIVAFSMFGLAWLAGIIEFVGTMVDNDGMANIGIAVSLVMPSDALWRGASYYAQTPDFLAQAAGFGGLPFAAAVPPAGRQLWWSALWVVVLLVLSVRGFARKDL